MPTPVLVMTPAHSRLAGPLSYASELPLAPGTLVRVPLGSRQVLGIVWDERPEDPAATPADAAIRPVGAELAGIAPLDTAWRQLITFTAGYYQRSLGEVALAALPPQLRELDAAQVARRLKRRVPATAAAADAATAQDGDGDEPGAAAGGSPAAAMPPLSAEQAAALEALAAARQPALLFGSTGSGKTEVYLRAVEALLERDAEAQALVLVPEINLTPQLEARFRARLARRVGADGVVCLHSGMTPAQRLRGWLAAHQGRARVLLGTRMAVLASLPRLRLIVVDEEHDPSYKQQEGARYSARDLAVYRGRLQSAQVLLGSATPSLESWHASRPAEQGGRYLRLTMARRIADAALPTLRLIDLAAAPRHCFVAPALVEAIGERSARGEQSLLFLNRRGYAPVLHCASCDWKSDCPHCSAFRVFHLSDRTLRCHHCGHTERVPRACPACGNPDIVPVGRGTEQLEQHLSSLLPAGTRIARIDADSARAKGALEAQLASVHAGAVDVLVGTQMVAKGHDFRRITLVAAVNPDNALYSSDFRAAERLFALLMQAAGRAGRDAAHSGRSEMWIQTWQPRHPMFAALARHDYPAHAARLLQERQSAGLPPFASLALLRAEARSQQTAQAFLQAARAAATGLDAAAGVSVYAPVPMPLARVANVERAQMLLESASRAALQRFLTGWQPALQGLRQPGLLRWAVDVDPAMI